MLDLRDLIQHPERYLVDGKPLLSAKVELQTLDGSVFIHRYDRGLQEMRVTPVAGVRVDALRRAGAAGLVPDPDVVGVAVPITAAMVIDLSAATDIPKMECKRALVETRGNVDAAKELLRVRGRNLAAGVPEGCMAAENGEPRCTKPCGLLRCHGNYQPDDTRGVTTSDSNTK